MAARLQGTDPRFDSGFLFELGQNMDQRQQTLPLLNSRQYGYENGDHRGGSPETGPRGVRSFRTTAVALSVYIQMRAWLDWTRIKKVTCRRSGPRTIELQLECWGKNANVLLRERFNATDSSFQCPLRSFFFLDVNVWQLFLQLITSKFIDGLPHIFRIVL